MEKWKKIPGFVDYEVSNFGRVRSWKIWGKTNKKPLNPRIMKPGIHPKGYEHILLRGNGKSISQKVHRLVLITFIGKPLKNQETGHLDGNPRNNHLNNLKWITAKENSSHKFIHKTMPAKLTEKMIFKMREDFRLGISYRDLVIKYGVSKANVSLIINKKTWRHI